MAAGVKVGVVSCVEDLFDDGRGKLVGVFFTGFFEAALPDVLDVSLEPQGQKKWQ